MTTAKQLAPKVKIGMLFSKKTVLIWLSFLFIVVQSISTVIPPLQSPDEFSHIKRAYLLSKGEIVLSSRNGVTGGDIDIGLLAYIENFDNIKFHPENKISLSDIEKSKIIEWNGKKRFSELASAPAYFPLPYMPQAAALLIGEQAGLSIDDSYRLARTFSLVAFLLILGLALLAFPAPPLVLALLLTPMSLFQLGSASLDAVTTSICVLCISLFMRGTLTNTRFTKGMMYAFSICIFALATSRFNLFPLTFLPLILFHIRRDKTYLLHFVVLVVISLSWLFIALKTVSISALAPRELSTGDIALYYIKSPSRFFEVLVATLKNYITAYWHSFVGILGWLDASLTQPIYDLFAVLLSALALTSINWKGLFSFELQRMALAVISILSIIFLFFLFLVSLSPHPAITIGGIQGRYFTTSFIVLSYAISDFCLSLTRSRISICLLFIIVALTTYVVPKLLVYRYYMTPYEEIRATAIISNFGEGKIYGELLKNRTFEQSFVTEGWCILGVDLNLATFNRHNSGSVTLELLDSNDQSIFRVERSVASINDNSWIPFNFGCISVVKGMSYKLRLTSIDGTNGDAITWWATTNDNYPKGKAIIDGSSQDTDFEFNIRFLQ